MKRRGWQFLGESIRGFAHERNDKVNQDFISWYQGNKGNGGLPLIMGISDGHGSDKYYRSNVGARIAVEVALEKCPKLIDKTTQGMPDIKLIDKLNRTLVTEWRRRVIEFEENNPVEVEERKIVEKLSVAEQKELENDRALCYGSTLLYVIVEKEFILFGKLGDGNIICADILGNVSEPLEKDPALIANETYSLCMGDAEKLFQNRIIFEADFPELILLATDGYSNSFSSAEDFHQAGTDFLRLIQEEGTKAVGASLKKFLLETSKKGSGDDITVGIIKRQRFGEYDSYEELDLKVSALKNLVENQEKEFERNRASSTQIFQRINLELKDLEASNKDLGLAVNKQTEELKKENLLIRNKLGVCQWFCLVLGFLVLFLWISYFFQK